MKPTPTEITLNQKENLLSITWTDGNVCRYPVSQLRMACPCADCRGGHENMGRRGDPKNLYDLQPPHPYHIEQLELVGNYALQPIWDDGHDSGIYTWEYLYRLCPKEAHDA